MASIPHTKRDSRIQVTPCYRISFSILRDFACRFVFDFLNYASYDESILNAYEAFEVYGIGQGVVQLQEANQNVDNAAISSGSSRQMRRGKNRKEDKQAVKASKPSRGFK